MLRFAAEKYKKRLGREGITPNILESNGSLENLKRLSDPSFQVDIGFVQGGLALAILKANQIEPIGATVLLDLAGKPAMDALSKHQIDAAFIMGDSAAPGSLRTM